MLSVASRSGTLLVLAMAIRSDFHETFRRIARLFYWFPKSLTCSKNRKSKLLWSQGGDVEKEKETHSYLSKEEIKEKVHKYNLAVTDKLKMTLNSNGIYTGFIKVQMELCRPPQTSPNSGKLSPSSNGCMNTLHISSTNTVGEVIEALLKKFLVTESPAKFALYKRCHREDQVYACKLSDREHPLYLRLVAGPRTDTLSFVLREHEIGEWEAFSLPELQNFLRILDKEEDEQLQNLRRRYAAYRHKLQEALREVWKPD
uniref:Ras association domain-containing protein 3 n=1 Tax=Rhinopithecus roxellana TaxID=61622 RepID=A0A2K6P7Z4_RHIRO